MPIVKELLGQINREKVWEEMKNNYFKSERYTEDILIRFKEGIISAIDEMLGIKFYPSDNWLITMCDYYDTDVDDNIVRLTATSLYDIKDIINKFKTFDFIDDATAYALTEEKLKDMVQCKPLIQVWGFEFSDWKEVLGYHVHDKSIKRYGLERCMASILFEMTYCGFSYAETKKNQNKPFGELTEHDIEDEEMCGDGSEYESEFINSSNNERTWLLAYLSWKEEYWMLKEVLDDFNKED